MNYAPPLSLLSGIGYSLAATVAMLLLMTFWWLTTGIVARWLAGVESSHGRDYQRTPSLERAPGLAAGPDLPRAA